jgi:glycosyltransferase involved in cell wall biosynthesis/ubiquinone/menaquinone biosynthesis C-methylase UbiE
LKILLVHEPYQRSGGEDAVFNAEKELLLAAGHRVSEFKRKNEEIVTDGFWANASVGLRTTWAWDSAGMLRTVLRKENPDIVHFHNTFPLISPAAYYVCREARVPVVQTLHNYRLLCPSGAFFRDGNICQECLSHGVSRSVRYGCYRNSRPATVAVALMLAFHNRLKTWVEMVDKYIAPTDFVRQKYVEAGVPGGKITVKPHFVRLDPGMGRGAGEYALFIGRLVPEKGVRTLVESWKFLESAVPLRIVGDGPLRLELEAQRNQTLSSDVRFEGWLSPNQLRVVMQRAAFLICPSEWYECVPLTLLEAFACGLPVIASRLGAMAEVVEDGRTGVHFTARDPRDLASKVEEMWAHRDGLAAMGRECRLEYETKYSADKNYRALMDVYRSVVQVDGLEKGSPATQAVAAAKERPDKSSVQGGTTPGSLQDTSVGRIPQQHLIDAHATESKVIIANQEFYREIASKYDRYETGTSDALVQKKLEDDLDKIGSYFASLGRPPSCLDCGGGTGNLTLKMCARGWTVTVVDVSGEMLDLLREKAHAQGYTPTLIRAPIERFLKSSLETFDFVAFSAVLHHLHSYASIVEQVASRVRAGGVFYSNYDPVVPKRPGWTWAFDSLDVALAKLKFDPGDIVPGIGRRIRKLISRRDPSLGRRVVSPGDIAEYHVRTGTSDGQVMQTLQKGGFEIVEHLRYATGRTSALRFLNERLRLLESFKIIARRDSRTV